MAHPLVIFDKVSLLYSPYILSAISRFLLQRMMSSANNCIRISSIVAGFTFEFILFAMYFLSTLIFTDDDNDWWLYNSIRDYIAEA